MKKLLLFLLLALVLTGCSTPPAPDPVPSTAPTVPEGTGLYDPDASLEQITGGAVKCYPLDDNTYHSLFPMKDGLLLQSRESTRLTLVVGENLIPAVEKQTPFHLQHLQVGSHGVFYLDEKSSSLIFLNSSLLEISRMALPEGLTGQVWLSPQWDVLYYCTADGVYRTDLTSGITRLLAAQNAAGQSVTGLYLEGTVLRCDVLQPDGTVLIQMRSCENGSILWEGTGLRELITAGEDWFARMDRGSVEELLFCRGGEIRSLWLEGSFDGIFPLPEQKAVITWQETERGCLLRYYSLVSGKCTAAVRLDGIGPIRDLCEDPASGSIWLLASSSASATNMLCLWDPDATPFRGFSDYTQPYYTRDEPDIQGLQTLNSQVEAIENLYGIRLLIGDDALPDPIAAAVQTEYLVPAYQRYLPVLRQVLSQFPEKMLLQAARQTPSGRVHIALVRSFEAAHPDLPVLFFRQDGEIYLVLSMDGSLEQNLYHGIYHILETRLLSASAAMYDWAKCNPAGFAYPNDYAAGESPNSIYLSGPNRAFIDPLSTTFLKEDRARILEYACMPGNETLFASPILQQKLSMLCKGIREAFGVKGTFLWEQYLHST